MRLWVILLDLATLTGLSGFGLTVSGCLILVFVDLLRSLGCCFCYCGCVFVTVCCVIIEILGTCLL